MIHEEIKGHIKEAMLAKDQVRLETLRAILSACTNELVSKGMKPQEILSDENTLTVISRIAKQRKDAISQFRAGNREDLAQEDEAQLKIIETFLPKQMDEEEIKNFVKSKIETLGDSQDTGKLIGLIMKDLKGRADGMLVKKIVEEM